MKKCIVSESEEEIKKLTKKRIPVPRINQMAVSTSCTNTFQQIHHQVEDVRREKKVFFVLFYY